METSSISRSASSAAAPGEDAASLVIDTSRHPRWGRIEPTAREEIDLFETELRRLQAGQMDERLFLEFRLRHGVYGQRQDGVQMLRIKIPLGRLTMEQMEVLADLSEEYAVGISHVTTRQDIQMHYIDINDTPEMMRRLAEVGITTKEACGNVVRNVCACPYTGACGGEAFDVTPHAQAMADFLLRHPDGQNFGRKFKISFSGCEGEACGLALLHDIGAIAQQRVVDGAVERGFKVYLGGGLGAVPHPAKVFDDFVPPEDMLPMAQAIARIFARLGEKRNRARARFKFVVAKHGIDEVRAMIREEMAKLKADARWTEHLGTADDFVEVPLEAGSELSLAGQDPGFLRWYKANCRPQKQPGYSTATVFLPLGDITADQLRGLAQVLRRYARDSVRLTVEQNIAVRHISSARLPELYEELKALRLHRAGAERLGDVTACPGTDSCKLGITASRGLAATLTERFAGDMADLAERDDVRVKISGCFNACGQHHTADIGFFGSVKKKAGRTAPVFQVVLGGTRAGNSEAFGLSIERVPARRAPEVVRHLTELFTREAQPGEAFYKFVERLGKQRMKDELAPFAEIPDFLDEPDAYLDNRQTWDYVMSTGVGECAGEVVDQAEFLLDDADRLCFESTVKLESGDLDESARLAYAAMSKAADGLLSTQGLLLSDQYSAVEEFKRFFYETGRFWKPTGAYYLRASEEGSEGLGAEATRRRVEEARLFIEEAEGVYSRTN
jgi:sulfite reductase (ferredoxin)